MPFGPYPAPPDAGSPDEPWPTLARDSFSGSRIHGGTGSARWMGLATIERRTEPAPRHVRWVLRAPEIAARARPGQFVHVLPALAAATPMASQDPLASQDPFLRRAFSIMSADTTSGRIELLFRVQGKGTSLLAALPAGASADLIGPLGNGFILPERAKNEDEGSFHVKQRLRVCLVGGGIGAPPLVFAAQRMARSQGTNFEIEMHAIIGARTANDLVCVEDIESTGARVEITTDDGSRGIQERVTGPLGRWLHGTASDADQASGEARTLVLACGPLPMLRAVGQACEASRIRAQLSLEEAMPCGVGVCNGCVVAIRPAVGSRELDEAPMMEFEYRRLCVQGPVVEAQEIAWI